MDEETERLTKKVKPKVKASVRTRPFYSVADMVVQYKTHIWPHFESTVGAYFHAADTYLCKLDAIQTGYLQNIQLPVQEAFLDHTFAPLRVRRDIGILGLLHKCVLGEELASLAQFFPQSSARPHSYSTRFAGYRHDRQIEDYCDASKPDFFDRSILGMAYVYNLLPQQVVVSPTVPNFQHKLSAMAKQCCVQGGSFEHVFCHIATRKRNGLFMLKYYDELISRAVV